MKPDSPLPPEPLSCSLEAHRLRLHYWDYGGEGPVLLLVHGLFDHARSWDRIAMALRGTSRVYAIDLRGHGDGPAVTGAAYSLVEHVLDVAALLRAVAGDSPVRLLAHSLGSLVALRYAAAFPESVAALAAIEGVSPPPVARSRPDSEADRLREWIVSVQRLEGKPQGILQGEPDALARLRRANPRLDEDWGLHLVRHGTNRAPGGLQWKHDPYLQGRWMPDFDAERDRQIYSRVACPVLVFRGLDSWEEDDLATGRLAQLRNLQVIDVAGAGHWVHHDQPDVVIREATRFFGAPLRATGDGAEPEPRAIASIPFGGEGA